jgi:hypothetical protein
VWLHEQTLGVADQPVRAIDRLFRGADEPLCRSNPHVLRSDVLLRHAERPLVRSDDVLRPSNIPLSRSTRTLRDSVY